MKILLIGCGFVGERAADLFHAAGHEVVGLSHSPESAARLRAQKPWQALACNISVAAEVSELRQQIGAVQAFIHCASSSKGGAEMYQAVYVDGMKHLLASFPEAWPLYTSSTSVYPQTDGRTVDETSPAEPTKETGRLLREAENLALQHQGAVARLAGIYGAGRSFLLKNLLEGSSGIEINEGAPEGRLINQIHADDAASALVHLITHKLSGVYNVVDDAQITQGDCLVKLAALFNLPAPSIKPPDAARKRGWTHKHVSNSKLRATGWSPQYPDYFRALSEDPELASSILKLVIDTEEQPLHRAENIILIGLMGSGKSTVGRIVAQKLGFQFVDTDHVITDQARCSIPEIFAREGEAGFRRRESAVLRQLLGRKHSVIATGGGIITQPVNLPLLKHLGFITWLEASTELLVRRTSVNNDRPLLRGEEAPVVKLQRLIQERAPIYKSIADLRILTDELTQQESAYGVAESARLFFSKRQPGVS
jgi:shikimate kinase/nucleoside-diphosphate-sugar epimerase